MSYDIENSTSISAAETDQAPLPADLIFTERMTRELRAWLRSRNLDDYRIFYCEDFDLYDIDRHLSALEEETTAWESGAMGQTIEVLSKHDKSAELRHSGYLHLRRSRIVLVNWKWFCLSDGLVKTFWLCAAPSPEQYEGVKKKVRSLRRKGASSVWQVISGYAWRDGPRSRRESVSADQLILSAALRERINIDIVGFFDSKVAEMYAAVGLPHRRGVLLHGPPGNGKTTLIRVIGAALPEVPVLLLRPGPAFDSDDLQQVIRRWSRQAPAILVIEDLNWLLKTIDVSLLLNLLDGIDSRSAVGDGGLMLIATTNHPEELDPALNNRPGRFDVVIEIPMPDSMAREQFLRRRLPSTDDTMLRRLAAMTDQLSFAHLEELLRTSGLLAIHAGRSERNDEDLLTAAASLRDSSDAARLGFPSKPEVRFGLEYLRSARR